MSWKEKENFSLRWEAKRSKQFLGIPISRGLRQLVPWILHPTPTSNLSLSLFPFVPTYVAFLRKASTFLFIYQESRTDPIKLFDHNLRRKKYGIFCTVF